MPTIEETIDRDIKPDEVFLRFNDDLHGLLFREWWESIGKQGWSDWISAHSHEFEVEE